MTTRIEVHNEHSWALDPNLIRACLAYIAGRFTSWQVFDVYPRDPAHPPGPWVIRAWGGPNFDLTIKVTYDGNLPTYEEEQ